jgi:hypothetical protein
MPLSRLQWGLADAVPPDATGAWGCRAIVTQDGYVDLVPDRTGQQGTELIFHLLDTQFPITRLTESLAALLRSGRMSTRRRERFELYKSATLTVAADTLASAGYCYLAAWTTTRVPGSDAPDR